MEARFSIAVPPFDTTFFLCYFECIFNPENPKRVTKKRNFFRRFGVK
jgi:hypothetical protein